MRRTLYALLTVAVLFGITPGVRAQAPEGEGGGAPPAPPPPNPRKIRELKLRFEREPTVTDVQHAALRFFKVHPERVASYRTGATWKALMPDVEVSFNNEVGRNDLTRHNIQYMVYEKSQGYPFFESEEGKRGSYVIGVRAHWALDRLIFNPEILDVSSLVGVQEGLLREITSLYFTRRRLLTSMTLNPPQDPNEEITEQLRLEEIGANIDALTGGFLSREIKKRLTAE